MSVKTLKASIPILAAIFLVLAIAVARDFNLMAQDSTQTNIKYNSKKDKLTYPQTKKIENALTVAGKIDAENKTDIRFQTSGKLAWVGVKLGDSVKKGQALASLDKRELKKTLQKEFNDYQTALSNFNDTNYTYKDKKERFLITEDLQRILDRSQFSLNNAVIDYELQDLTIKYATITTPISGIVTAVEQPVAGVNITPATSTISVVDPQSIFFRSKIDESDVPKIKIGQSATIRIDSFSDKTISSSIKYISFLPISGESSTVYEIKFVLNESNPDYRLGMNGDATIILEQSDNSITIPIEYLQEENDKKYVLVKQGDKIVKKFITTGIENDTEIQVTDGLNQNDQIVQKIK